MQALQPTELFELKLFFLHQLKKTLFSPNQYYHLYRASPKSDLRPHPGGPNSQNRFFSTEIKLSPPNVLCKLVVEIKQVIGPLNVTLGG